MKVFGRLFEQDKQVVLDAEPHVMQRIRPLFLNGRSLYGSGKYTHNPIAMTMTKTAAKDLLWVHSRYNLDINQDTLSRLESMSAEYDRILKSVENSADDGVLKLTEGAIPYAIPLRDHQIKFNNMVKKTKRILLADKIGLGKTFSALSVLAEAEYRPALIVCPTHLCSQWERELKRLLPGITSHIIKGFKNYELPNVDVLITTYGRLQPWQDVLLARDTKTLILEEVHEIRHTGTGKRELARLISEKVECCIGLSGTPIYNYGAEIWSIMDVIAPECLGTRDEFMSEWCSWERVREPSVLNGFLRSLGLMLRREPEDVGLNFGTTSKHVYTIDADLKELEKIENVAKMLAISVLSGRVGESDVSARELDWKLRHASGVAKAKPVAEFVKMMCEQGEKVVLAGWHRDVYDIWLKELKEYNPVMFTGSETTAQKDKAVKEFIEGSAKVFIISLRSGIGLDGLQRVSNTVVFGELDWSPHVMDQVFGRVARDGQTKHAQAYYLTIADGADPFMMKVLNVKRSQHDGVVEGKNADVEILKDVSPGTDRIKEMAREYLASIGEEAPVIVEEIGLMGEVARALRKIRVSTNTEVEMQESVNSVLPGMLPDSQVEREFKMSARSRLDFLVSKGDEKVAIECKINSTKRAEVYRQVRRYVEDAQVTSVVLYAPWQGVPSFVVDGIPVIIVDPSLTAL